MKTTFTNTNKDRARNYKNGSSITEVLVSLVLFAIFIGGACKVVTSTSAVSDKAHAHYVAINIAKNQIEQVRNLRRSDFDQILALQESNTPVDGKGQPTTEEVALYNRTTTITKDTRNDYLIEVTVEVGIKDRAKWNYDNGEKEVLQSYIAHLLD
jgi:Tfp pilus assembly protein PilV